MHARITTAKIKPGKMEDICPLKPRCCRKAPARRISRDPNEAARDYNSCVDGDRGLCRRQERTQENRVGDVKRNLGLTRLRLRGLTGARDEFLLVATVQNLKRLARLAAIHRQDR